MAESEACGCRWFSMVAVPSVAGRVASDAVIRGARRPAFMGLLLGALLAGLLVGAAPVSPAAAASAPLPERLRAIGDARQVIVVTAADWSTSRATLQMWERYSGGWSRKATMAARLGWSGFSWATERRQGDGSTPAGTFTLTRAFGLREDPGTRLPYRRAWSDDYWVYDARCPSSYNTWQKWSRTRCWSFDEAEKLVSYGAQYEAAAVIDFNIPSPGRPADVRRGGGIFLHVNGSGATAGCVSLARSDLLRVLRWLDPAKAPRIVMAPSSVITRA
jgi:L,D-peptidoglycan transpeptidase YkuD (ErfK/YbiS/YcfS/YnhG family)